MLRRNPIRKVGSRGFRIAIAILFVCVVAVLLWKSPLGKGVATATLTGVVLAQNVDLGKQAPISDADILVRIGRALVRGKSNSEGYFQVILPRKLPNQEEELTIRHDDFQPFTTKQVDSKQILIARLAPISTLKDVRPNGAVINISNVKIRYTLKAENTMNIGSIVRPFKAVNIGNVLCSPGSPCSPDGKWKATVTKVHYDAGENNQFLDIRASCVAGPCAFTKIERSNIADPVRVMEISVLNWSDTATFLIEAEVSRTMVNDMVREAFPAVFGTSMDFTLPAAAEGPSIEAELNGTNIVFPLGPNLLLSWATCTAEPAPEQTRLFRCELKPSFVFR